MEVDKTIHEVHFARFRGWHFGCTRAGGLSTNVAFAPAPSRTGGTWTLIDELLAEQQSLTAVERFARAGTHRAAPALAGQYRQLLPASPPGPGQQYAFEVDLDKCSGCKACVTACHSLNGLDESETWRSVGLLVSERQSRQPDFVGRARSLPEGLAARCQEDAGGWQTNPGFHQHVTTACHHCIDPGCLNGCPVLAYDKDPVTGIVRHLDDQCIGCQYCVLKCPYEVPKYSSRLGIVRKCDLCSQRLAVGEAPACVQACPDEAIRISLVSSAEIASAYRPDKTLPEKSLAGNHCVSAPKNLRATDAVKVAPVISKGPSFLPDSPDPAVTLPTTRFVSARLPGNLIAADHDAPRLDQPHWPLILMLVLTQAATGLFLAAGLAAPTRQTNFLLPITAFALLGLGLTASTLHLGQPMKAWRAFLGWRRSWLSREIIAFNGFAAAAGLVLVMELGGPRVPRVVFATAGGVHWGWLAVAMVGLVAVLTSVMVYVDTQRAYWSPKFVAVSFSGTVLLLGASGMAWGLGLGEGAVPQVRQVALAALLIRGFLFLWRLLQQERAWRDAHHPVHFNVASVRSLLPWLRPVQAFLFAGGTGFGLLLVNGTTGLLLVWATLAVLADGGAELLARYEFFVGSVSKRMPGGLAA